MALKMLLAALIILLSWLFFQDSRHRAENRALVETCQARDGKLVRGIGNTYICVKREAIL